MTAIDTTQPAPAGKNSFERLAGALIAPAETFADIARRPDILIPLLLFIAIGYVTIFLSFPHLDFDAAFAQQAEILKKQNPNMTDADIERMGGFTKAIMKGTQFVGPLLVAVWWAVLALILFGAFRLMGADVGYKQALSATLYAWVPLTLFSILSTIVIVMRGNVDPTHMATIVKSNPAFLVDMQAQPVLYSLLASFDVFTIWTIVLLVFGFAAASKFSRAKSAAIIVSLWIVMLVIKVGFAALGAARMNA
ncbi:MAG: YIP1 family protein [Thermoanaerobaculia bacterium]